MTAARVASSASARRDAAVLKPLAPARAEHIAKEQR